jgi:hypothetical protein
MAVSVRATEKSVTTGDSGEFRAMHLHKSCGYANCEEPGITSVGDEDLCCDHFVLRSYEFLQRVDEEQSRGDSGVDESARLTSSVNSCLQGALEVSLRSASLNNLQKARLLDIILWAGEYLHRGESRRIAGPGSFRENALATKNLSQRSAYQEPEIKSRTLVSR